MGNTGKPQILIVDDHSYNIEILTTALKGDYKIKSALSGAAALEEACKSRSDIILLDLMMPGIDGFEVLTRLKSMEETKEIPVIISTGSTADGDVQKAFYLGAEDFVRKPYGILEIQTRVKKILQRVNADKEKNKYIAKIEKLLEITTRDEKGTGLYNRRYFEKQLAKEWGLSARSKAPMSIILLDIDHFKKFNDIYGHFNADRVLVTVGNIMQKLCKRSTDIPIRWGGEEFIIFLPNTDVYGAAAIAEKLRIMVEDELVHMDPYKNVEACEAKVTISVGVYTTIASQHETKVDFTSKADAAMYEAKQKGRNQVVVHPESYDLPLTKVDKKEKDYTLK